MGKYLNVGNAGFAAVRKGIYVDKTGLISYISRTLGTADKLTCVSRPRRFGKCCVHIMTGAVTHGSFLGNWRYQRIRFLKRV